MTPKRAYRGNKMAPIPCCNGQTTLLLPTPSPLPYYKNEGLIRSLAGSTQRKMTLERTHRGNEMAPLLCCNGQTALLLPTPRLP